MTTQEPKPSILNINWYITDDVVITNRYAMGGFVSVPEVQADHIPVDASCGYIIPKLSDKQRRRLILDLMALEDGPDDWAENDLQGDK